MLSVRPFSILAKELPTMAPIPESYLDLLQQKKAFADLATVMPDGSPQVTPVWFDYNNGLIRVNTAKGRVKQRNMKEGSPVALSIMDPDNPYRYLQVRGKVSRMTEEGASAHIDSLAKKYLGKDKYPFSQPGEVRVLYEITPTAAQGMN
jgi:PPOX class probable F420-dependent enzyme